MQKAKINTEVSKKDLAEWKSLAKMMKSFFVGEEILCEKEEYAVIRTISDAHLYQAIRNDLIGTDMKCLAQVKRVFPKGTALMKNTLFAKFKDKNSKDELIESMKEFTENEYLEFDSNAIVSIEWKPVYQLEIIALYQSN